MPWRAQSDNSRSTLHILTDSRGLDTFPSVYNALYLWKRSGWRNSIATPSSCDGFEGCIDRVYPVRGKWTSIARQLAKINSFFDVIVVYEPLDAEAFSLSVAYGAKWKYRYLLHHSLEVPTHLDPVDSIKKYLHKALMKYCLNRVDNVIIQDASRLDLLKSIFPTTEIRRSTLVPNTYIASIEPVSAELPWFDKIREESKPLVLYAGTIERWALSTEMFEAIKRMKEVNFLFSGWSRDGFSEELVRRYEGAENIHFSLGIKSRGDLNYMVSRSDIGLAYYNLWDDNVRYMGLSSGKINKYLSFGKPVVVNKMLNIAGLVEEKGFGRSADIETLAGSIHHILADYRAYRKNINDRFLVEYDFEGPYLKIIDEIERGLSY